MTVKTTTDIADGRPPEKREYVEFKFLVQPVLLETRDGKSVGELVSDPVPVYGLDGLRRFIEGFPGDLQKLNDQIV